jgi:two-component system, sensor histidine kinase and response regulator
MKRILIIDDNSVVVKTVSSMIKTAGFDVISTTSGKTGVEMAKDNQPDLILCDIEMPDLNGYDVLVKLLNDNRTSNIPFIFMTAAKKKRTEQRYGMTLGADDYLTKPFSKEELISSINARLEKRKISQEESEKRMEELRSNIVYALPHEFRTPLTTILMSSQYLEKRSDTINQEEIMKIASRITNAGNHLQKLLENYLLYTQIEVIKTNPKKIESINEKVVTKPSITINNMAQSIADKYNRESDIQVNVIDNPIRITQQNLQKVIQESIDNAFKFSEKNSPISVNTQIDDQYYNIIIMDEGRGMTDEQLNNMGAYMQFERRAYEQQGSGFGLVICKKLLELHSGDMVIESEPDEYTRITIRILLA